ncbi:hypothetical protein [Paraflavitalea speifideaquila]|uniref:hypothetical protein n=1 Tax=Paraflavitalea speifideaquila TaxID=3076558 RepID=UPI0028EBD718|nr:hypothetical protein [Paraflavitalea speifideiaquila]
MIGRTAWDKQVTSVLAPGSQYYINNEALRPSFTRPIGKSRHLASQSGLSPFPAMLSTKDLKPL